MGVKVTVKVADAFTANGLAVLKLPTLNNEFELPMEPMFNSLVPVFLIVKVLTSEFPINTSPKLVWSVSAGEVSPSTIEVVFP